MSSVTYKAYTASRLTGTTTRRSVYLEIESVKENRFSMYKGQLPSNFQQCIQVHPLVVRNMPKPFPELR
jgi:hypothetical protein